MPIPNAVSTRLAAAIAAVDANTDLDLLISLIDVGQRSGSDITVAAAELTRRANLVDSNTPSIEASKIAAGVFKIDYPVINLWGGAGGGGGGGVEVGQIVSGHLSANPKYVPANGSRYLSSAYPDMAPILTSGQLTTFMEPITTDTLLLNSRLDTTSTRELTIFTDDNVIIIPTQPHVTSLGYLGVISTDSGATWRGMIPKSALNSGILPEFANAGLVLQSCLISFCKLENPGHYGALISNSSGSGGLWYIYTEDYGVTWKGVSQVITGVNTGNPDRLNIYYRNGALLFVGNSTAKYSTNAGQTWTTLADASWAASNMDVYHQLTDDGYIIHCGQTTSVVYFQWPATPAGWNASLALTTVTSKFAAARTWLKKCGEYWIAFSTTSNVVYIATSLLGTYTAATWSGITGIRDVRKFGNDFLILAAAANGNDIYYIAASASSGTALPITNTATPAMSNATTALRWPLGSNRWPMTMAGAVVPIFRHGRESIAKISSVTGSNNIQHLFTVTPTWQFPHFCRKYNQWFCSVPADFAAVNANPVNGVDLGSVMLHYRSTNGKDWVGIGRGWSGIVDAGSRLLRISGNGRLEQSTDGVIWDTTGITMPTLATVNAARLWRVKDAIYFYTSGNAGSFSSGYLYVSKNNGSTWTTVAGLASPGMFAFAKGSMTYYNGKYFAAFCYNSASINSLTASNADYGTLYISDDGITFVATINVGISVSTYSPNKLAVFVSDGVLWVLFGTMSSTTQQITYVSADGKNFVSASGSNLLSRIQAASIMDCDYSSDEQLWMFDEITAISSSSVRVLYVYSNSGLIGRIAYSNGNSNNYVSAVGGSNGEYMAANTLSAFTFSTAVTSFLVPTPNSGTSPMPFPHMRVSA